MNKVEDSSYSKHYAKYDRRLRQFSFRTITRLKQARMIQSMICFSLYESCDATIGKTVT